MCLRTETFSLKLDQKGRYAPPMHTIKLTKDREITPYVLGASGRGEVRTLVGAGGFFATKFAYVRFGHSEGISTPGGLVGPDVYRPDNVARRAAS
jgi:hypothetical protein